MRCTGAAVYEISNYNNWQDVFFFFLFLLLFFFPSTASNLWSNFKRASEARGWKNIAQEAWKERMPPKSHVLSRATGESISNIDSRRVALPDSAVVNSCKRSCWQWKKTKKKQNRRSQIKSVHYQKSKLQDCAGLVSVAVQVWCQKWGDTLQSGVLLF